MTEEHNLPELPKPKGELLGDEYDAFDRDGNPMGKAFANVPCFTADQLRTYAAEAVRTALAQQAGEPVAWHKPGTVLVVHRDVKASTNEGNEYTLPLYAAQPQAEGDRREAGWISVEERLPPEGKEVLVWVRESYYWPKPHAALDTWNEQREDPLGMGGPTISVGHMWDNHDFDQVSHWKLVEPPAMAARTTSEVKP